MLRQTLPIEQIHAWMQLSGVACSDVTLRPGENGTAVLAARSLNESSASLMRVPSDIVLSLENVWILAKSDGHLLQVLEATEDISRSARGAILIFILLQLTHNASKGRIGVASPWSTYVQFLPQTVPLPTTWTDDEKGLIRGTSLEAATESKLHSLDQEFDHLRENTSSIQWCREFWWEETKLGLEDWKYADAIYRSRALDLPGTGHAMVPCVDMANHASGTRTNAIYETDRDGSAMLLLRDSTELNAQDEITITYGDDKGACEMLFSYGFLEEGTSSANELFLDIAIPEDDPLGRAKAAASHLPPGFKIFKTHESVDWEGPLIWLLCVNEEDGLAVQVARTNDGRSELLMSFKGEALLNGTSIETLLRKEALWDVYRLRAMTMLQDRVERQLLRLKANESLVQEIQQFSDIRPEVEGYAVELIDLEETLLLEAYEAFDDAKAALTNSTIVRQYLSGTGTADSRITHAEDDFS